MKFFHQILIALFFIVISTSHSDAQPQYSNSINSLYEHVWLEGDRSNWNLGQLWYENKFSSLTSILRIRYADRFEQSVYLVETDQYPEFSENTYAHIGAGASLSGKGLFPNFKASGILYHNLSSSVIGGIGLRYQSFDIDNIFVYNADIHLYVSDYLFLIQGFMQYRNKTPLGTGVLTVRKYLSYPDYLFVKLAYGQSPQGLRFEEDVLNTFESFFVSVGTEFHIFSRFGMSAALEYRKNDFSSATTRQRYGFSMGLSYHF